jgi:predicted P-loop ATPase
MIEDCKLNAIDAEKRRDAALLRALSTPHKRQNEMKIGMSPKGKKGRQKQRNLAKRERLGVTCLLRVTCRLIAQYRRLGCRVG